MYEKIQEKGRGNYNQKSGDNAEPGMGAQEYIETGIKWRVNSGRGRLGITKTRNPKQCSQEEDQDQCERVICPGVADEHRVKLMVTGIYRRIPDFCREFFSKRFLSQFPFKFSAKC